MDRRELEDLIDDCDAFITEDDPWAPRDARRNALQCAVRIDPRIELWRGQWDAATNGRWIDYVTTDWTSRRTTMMRRWSRHRMQRQLDSFAARLWPGELTGWRVEACHFVGDLNLRACCEPDEKRISIDLAKHNSERHVRGTLLHDLYFFSEVERLIKLGFRPAIDFGLYLDEPDTATVRAELPRCAELSRRAQTRVHRLR